MASTAIPTGAHPLHQRLHALAQRRAISGEVTRSGMVHAATSTQRNVGPVTVQGAASGVALGRARAAGQISTMPGRTEASFSAEATGLAQAQTTVTAQALGVLSAAMTASASLAATAHAEGRAVIGEQQVGLEASAGAVALAEVTATAAGSANLGVLQAHGKAGISAEARAEASAHGRAWFGVDSLGLPGFSLGAAARTDAAAGVRTHAEGGASILGLIEVGGSGSLKALAGAASSFLGSIGFRDGKLSVGAGVGAAAGLGGEAQAGVSVGMGKLPRGVTQTVVAPILSVPVLLTTSLVNGVGSLFGDEPWEGAPGITDLPEVVANHVKTGIKTIGHGAEEVADQVVSGVRWLGRQIGSLFD
ncbi:hypothetical protein D3C72_170600 [compost metagenome]